MKVLFLRQINIVMIRKKAANQLKSIRKPVSVPESDIKLVQGLIDRDSDSEKVFDDQYREHIYNLFSFAHEKMKIKANLTDKLKDSLFIALCDNLHSSEDQQLKDFLAGKKESTLFNFLVVKASIFCRDMFLVKGLKDGDKEITTRVFYGDDNLSFQRIMIKALNEKDIRDYEKGGKRMSSIDFASDMYDQLMTRLNQDKFRFEGSLYSYFASVVRTRLNEMINDKKRDIMIDDIDDYKKSSVSKVSAYIEYERKEVYESFNELFETMIHRGVPPIRVEVLKDKYLEGYSAKEIAIKKGITENLVNQWVFRTKGELLKAVKEHDDLF